MSPSEAAKFAKRKRWALVEAVHLKAPNPHTRSSGIKDLAHAFADMSSGTSLKAETVRRTEQDWVSPPTRSVPSSHLVPAASTQKSSIIHPSAPTPRGVQQTEEQANVLVLASSWR